MGHPVSPTRWWDTPWMIRHPMNEGHPLDLTHMVDRTPTQWGTAIGWWDTHWMMGHPLDEGHPLDGDTPAGLWETHYMRDTHWMMWPIIWWDTHWMKVSHHTHTHRWQREWDGRWKFFLCPEWACKQWACLVCWRSCVQFPADSFWFMAYIYIVQMALSFYCWGEVTVIKSYLPFLTI